MKYMIAINVCGSSLLNRILQRVVYNIVVNNSMIHTWLLEIAQNQLAFVFKTEDLGGTQPFAKGKGFGYQLQNKELHVDSISVFKLIFECLNC